MLANDWSATVWAVEPSHHPEGFLAHEQGANILGISTKAASILPKRGKAGRTTPINKA
jgi:hypothetical protein